MRQPIKRLSIVIWISLLTGCGGFAGNVVPQSAPAMETIYDTVPEGYTAHTANTAHTALQQTAEDESGMAVSTPASVNAAEAPEGFTALPNPALKLTIFPHLAGKDRLPIPAYTTVFHPYAETQYVLQP